MLTRFYLVAKHVVLHYTHSMQIVMQVMQYFHPSSVKKNWTMELVIQETQLNALEKKLGEASSKDSVAESVNRKKLA